MSICIFILKTEKTTFNIFVPFWNLYEGLYLCDKKSKGKKKFLVICWDVICLGLQQRKKERMKCLFSCIAVLIQIDKRLQFFLGLVTSFCSVVWTNLVHHLKSCEHMTFVKSPGVLMTFLAKLWPFSMFSWEIFLNKWEIAVFVCLFKTENRYSTICGILPELAQANF